MGVDADQRLKHLEKEVLLCWGSDFALKVFFKSNSKVSVGSWKCLIESSSKLSEEQENALRGM